MMMHVISSIILFLSITWMHDHVLVDAINSPNAHHDSDDGTLWVFLRHSPGDSARFRAVSDTWFSSGQLS